MTDPQTERVKRIVLWGLAFWLWFPALATLATTLTYMLWVSMGKDW